MKDKYIVLIVGKSGSGKSTICDRLEKEYGLRQVKSYTTRPRRGRDDNGHIFISDEELDRLEDICGFTTFDKHRYCATSKQIDNADLYIIDPKGVEYFMKSYVGKKIPMVIYINADEKIRRKRMKERGDSADKIRRRLSYDAHEFGDVEDYVFMDFTNHTLSDMELIVEYIYHTFFAEKE